MTQAVDDAFADLQAKVDAEGAKVTETVTLLKALSADIVALTALVQANPADPTILTRLQALSASVATQTQTLSDADAANPVPPTP